MMNISKYLYEKYSDVDNGGFLFLSYGQCERATRVSVASHTLILYVLITLLIPETVIIHYFMVIICSMVMFELTRYMKYMELVQETRDNFNKL